MNAFKEFTGLYPLSKTLRFELKPQGRTMEWIQKNGILEEDQHRAESYVQVKKIIDEYHMAFIELALHDFKLVETSTGGKNSLEEYHTSYNKTNKDEKDKKIYSEIQANLRKQIAKRLTSHDAYKRIFKKKLIQEDLIEFVRAKENVEARMALIEEFQNFTTYFTNFHKNRKNMYTDAEQSTAIVYRLIHENLPKFVDNMHSFAKLMETDLKEKLPALYAELEEYLNVACIEEMFALPYYNMVLTQAQIEVYNAVLGGKTLSDNRKVQGLNEIINLYNQQHKEARLPKLKPLFKQILSDREAISWLPEKFKSDIQALKAIKEGYDLLSQHVLAEDSLKQLLSNLDDYDLSGIYIRNDLQLTDISQKMFGSWSIIPSAIKARIDAELPIKKKEKPEERQKRIDSIFKSHDSFSIAYINDCLQASGILLGVESYFAELGAVNTEKEQRANLFACIANAYVEVEDLLANDYPTNKNLAQDKKNVERIKNLLDAIKDLQHFVKPLLGKGDESDKDERFYGELSALWSELDQITPLYNMVRNYMTRKPYSTEKIKINFSNPVLLKGYNEQANSCTILKIDGLWYLAVCDKSYRRFFNKFPAPKSKEDELEKMLYSQAADPSKDVQNLMVVNGVTKKVNGRKEKTGEFIGQNIRLEKMKQECLPPTINKIRLSGSYSVSNKNFQKKDLVAFIDFYKQRTIEYFSTFKFVFKDSYEYVSFKEFTDDINSQAYQIQFIKTSKEYIENLIDEGKLYLFQIYNKDFSPYSKGTPNMHTLYWKILFDEKNLADVVYKLNGQAEVFFRKSSISVAHPTHPANHPIKNKNKDNKKTESVFPYDLIKDRRYTIDKLEFHVPITMNFKSTGMDNINQRVNEYLQHCDDAHVIGIDRGERHLLYLVVVDKYGRIKEQFSLNEIVNEHAGNKYTTDYHSLLQRREEERMQARQSWKSIETIKELKEGYLSQVIHKITELMVKYNAIVVLEDLNFGFMRGRQKVEKQVYQKFEKMMILC